MKEGEREGWERGEGKERKGWEGRIKRERGRREEREWMYKALMMTTLSLCCVQNTFNQALASVCLVHPSVRGVLVPAPLTVCSVPPALHKSSTMTDHRELKL